jgi:pyruvate/2-oxoglutarate dehydrogenase complex dihydrolipoamide dehydrogenase (E3) component
MKGEQEGDKFTFSFGRKPDGKRITLAAVGVEWTILK